jgi:DNA polymerase III delta prime subunit
MNLENTLTRTEDYFSGRQYNNIKKPVLPIHIQITAKLDRFLETKKVPNILFHGVSGSGKRTIVNSFISKIYNDDKYRIKQNVMNVNCSHGKGIKFIREELKFFAKTNIQSDNGTNFKTIVLLNADQLTIDAQSALRRCIELFSYNTRFFIIVENKHKLLNPILSRFCEIYVPEFMENGTIINLHRKMNHMENMEKNSKEHLWILAKMYELEDKEITHNDLLTLSNQLYEKGLSCMDLIHWVENNDTLDKLLKVSTVVYFDKIKSEYRSEPLLIFTILDYLFIRKNKDICF